MQKFAFFVKKSAILNFLLDFLILLQIDKLCRKKGTPVFWSNFQKQNTYINKVCLMEWERTIVGGHISNFSYFPYIFLYNYQNEWMWQLSPLYVMPTPFPPGLKRRSGRAWFFKKIIVRSKFVDLGPIVQNQPKMDIFSKSVHYWTPALRMGPMKLARTRGIWHIMLVQGEDKLCPYVLTGRKKNYGIRSL